MAEDDYHEMVEAVIEDSEALALSTSDGSEPWVAPVEYFRDDAGTFYFFSTTDSRHAQHIEANDTVAVAIWGDGDQPEYSPDLDTTLRGVQIRGRASRLSQDEFPPMAAAAAEELDIPMPPYTAFQIEPERVYAPIIEDGINKRVELDMG